MTFFPDMGTITMVAAGSHVRAIGWLDRDHEFNQGDVPERFVSRLTQFVDQWQESARALGFPVFLGGHECGFCGDAYDSGDFGVPRGKLLFVAPVLILHYVRCHRYLPPPEFVTAVMKSPLPRTFRYGLLVLRFQRSRISREDEQQIGEAINRAAVRDSMSAGRSYGPQKPTSGKASPANDPHET
jgi:hypothetical protein